MIIEKLHHTLQLFNEEFAVILFLDKLWNHVWKICEFADYEDEGTNCNRPLLRMYEMILFVSKVIPDDTLINEQEHVIWQNYTMQLEEYFNNLNSILQFKNKNYVRFIHVPSRRTRNLKSHLTSFTSEKVVTQIPVYICNLIADYCDWF